MPTLYPPLPPPVDPNAPPPQPGANLDAIQVQNSDQPSPQQVIAQQTQQALPAAVASQGPFVSQEAPADQIPISSRQFTAGTVDTNALKSGLATQEGNQKADMLNRVADVQTSKAADAQKNAADFQSDLAIANAKSNAEHIQHQAAYDEYKKVAGNLKDPSSQFWQDKGQGSRITAALALAAGGFSGNDHFANFLNKEIDNNYNAHKQNIDDLYRGAVEAGKIEDSTENHNRFNADMKLKAYDLARMAFADQIDSETNRGNSKIAKTIGSQVVAGLTQDSLAARRNQAILDAQQATAGRAAAKAKQDKIAEQVLKLHELYHSDYGPEQENAMVAKGLKSLGYTDVEIAPHMTGLGATYKAGEGWIPPEVKDQGNVEPTFDEKTNRFLTSSVDSQGKKIKNTNEEQTKLDARTENVDGVPTVFRTPEHALAQNALGQAKDLYKELQNAYQAGDKGKYDSIKGQLLELGPRLLDYKRGPSLGQIGSEERAHQDEESKGTLGVQIPDMPDTIYSTQFAQKIKNSNIGGYGANNSPAGIAISKLKQFGKNLDSIEKEVHANIVRSAKKGLALSGEDLKKELDKTTEDLGLTK